MARFLFSALGARGHLYPLVSIAKVLQARGHEIALYTSSHYRYLAENNGFTFLPPQKWRDFDFAHFEEYWPEMKEMTPAKRNMQIYFSVFVGTAKGQAGDLLQYCNEFKPDVLVTDPYAFGTAIVAKKASLPWASITMALRRMWMPFMGIYKAPEPDLYLVQGLEAFEPDKSTITPTTHFVGACQWDDADGFEDFVPPHGDLPLVYIGLGTMFADEAFFRKAIQASAGQPWHVLVTTSDKIDPAVFEPLPPNVTVTRYVPYSKVWPHASAVVTHGGSGPLLGALRHGLPLVVVPTEADTQANANCLESCGVGVRLDLNECTVEDVRQAIREVLHNESYRVAARLIQAEVNRAGGAPRAADLLEQLALSAAIPS